MFFDKVFGYLIIGMLICLAVLFVLAWKYVIITLGIALGFTILGFIGSKGGDFLILVYRKLKSKKPAV